MARDLVVTRVMEAVTVFGEHIDPGREENPRARLERARELTDELRARVGALMDPA